MSTKAKKAKPFTVPPDWWKTDISNPEALRREFIAVEGMFNSLEQIKRVEEDKAKDVELANIELEELAMELERQEQERKRKYGNRFPMVYERLAASPVSENNLPRRLGRPKGSKNKPK